MFTQITFEGLVLAEKQAYRFIMKTHPIDFILSGIFLSLICSISLFMTAWGIVPYTRPLLQDYHTLADLIFFLLFYGLISGFITRLLIKIYPLKPGEYTMDDHHFTYWKLLTMIQSFAEFCLHPITPMIARPLVSRLFGAKLGHDVALAGVIECPYLVTVGDNTILGYNSAISPNVSLNNKIIFGKIKIGHNVTIGVNSIILPDVEIGDGAQVGIGSVVVPGTKIPPGETWKGNPARPW